MPDTLRDLGETDLIARILARLPAGDNVRIPAGDDCAVVASGGPEDWVLTSDPVIEGTHFLPDTPGERVGHKAVGRVLSDLAAMGATPRWGLINMVAPDNTAANVLDSIYDGVLALANRHGFALIGGDLAAGPLLELHVFGVGSVPAGTAVSRAGARVDDILLVTGKLGGSRYGRHLDITPRVAEGIFLRNWATAMIDVSDGLATDLRHIVTAGGTGCALQTAAIPISTDAHRADDDMTALEHALHDGEDFELLFTLPPPRETAFRAAWDDANFALPVTRIGRITDHAGHVRCILPNGESVALSGAGYRHFVQHKKTPR